MKEKSVLKLEQEFNAYCKKVRGWLIVPCGVYAVIAWQEFLEWRKQK
jgi:hypothetical protein